MITTVYILCVTLSVIFASVGWMGVAIVLGIVAAVLVARSDAVTWGSLLRPS